MQWTNETWYRVVRTFIQALAAALSGLVAQGAFQSPTVTAIVSAVVLFLSTALMNLEQVPNGKPADVEIDSGDTEGYNNQDE